MLKPKKITVKSMDGDEISVTISRIPASYAREILTQYPTSAMPKIGEYQLNESLMFKMMRYVAVKMDNGEYIQLGTRELIDNHIPDFDALAQIEFEMLTYNSNFFNIGKISQKLGGLVGKLTQWITRILTPSSASSSAKEKQPSKS